MKGKIDWQKKATDWPHRLPELQIDVLQTALLVVDISNDLSEPVSRVLPNIIRLRDFFRQQDLKVLYCLVGSLLPDGRDRHIKRRLTWHRSSADAPEKIRAKGTFSYQIREELKPLLPMELVIDKDTGSAFNSSAIDRLLHAMGIQNLVVSGLITSRCVENTARDAADLGYNVILVEDACGDRIPENHQATMHSFGRVFGSVKSTAEVIADLSRLLAQEPSTGKEVTT